MVRFIEELKSSRVNIPKPKLITFSDGLTVIYDGFPVLDGGFIYPLVNPHVFFAGTIVVKDRRRSLTLYNKLVMLGEGLTRGGTRIFADGQPISEVVTKYQQNAGRLGLPSLDVLIACGGDVSNEVYASNFDVPYYTVGGQVHLKNTWSKNGKLQLKVDTESGFVG